MQQDKHENTLCHYGVLGMRWGVRRYQNKDGSLTALGKKHYTASSPGKHDGDIIIEKDDAVTHISSKKKMDMKNRSTYVFDHNNKHDRVIYSGKYASNVVRRQYDAGKNPRIYAHMFKTKHEGVIAGMKTMRTTFDELKQKHGGLIDSCFKELHAKLLKDGYIIGNTSYEEFKKDDNRMFNLFIHSTLDMFSTQDSSKGVKNIPINKHVVLGKMYTETLQHKKYIGMKDLHDTKHYYGAETPMIIFNGKKTLEDSKVLELPLSGVQYQKMKVDETKWKSYLRDMKF